MPKPLSYYIEKTLRGLALIVLVIWSVVPVLFIVIGSFKRQVDIFVYPPLLVFTPTLDNYIKLWSQWGSFFGTLTNSLIVSVGATLLAGIVRFVGGYA